MRHQNIFYVLCICFGTSASKDSKYLVRVRIYQLILHHPFQVQKCGSIQGCTVRSRMKYALVLDFDFDYKINTYIADNKNVPEYFFD